MQSRYAAWKTLALSTAGLALVWCVVLPWLSAKPAVRERIEFLADRGIDASAMYYTELDAMDAILGRLEGQQASPRLDHAR